MMIYYVSFFLFLSRNPDKLFFLGCFLGSGKKYDGDDVRIFWDFWGMVRDGVVFLGKIGDFGKNRGFWEKHRTK
jgi:hypothetical protein